MLSPRQPRLGRLLVLTGCLAIVAGAQPAPNWGKLTSVQIEATPTVTRVRAQLTGAIDIRHGRLENPPRFYIDFADTTPALPGQRGVATVPATGPHLKQIRVAENQKGVTRLVFDLPAPDIDYQTIADHSHSELLIELRPRSTKGKIANPLATPPPSSPPPSLSQRPPAAQPMIRAGFQMPEPPRLTMSARLPAADPNQLPYRVSGYVLRDFIATPPSLPRPAEPKLERRTPEATAVAAKRTANGRQSLTRVLGLKIGKVVIDPGHGGHDVGTIGATGLLEKDVTLDIAKRLSSLIEEKLGSQVVLTRTDDVYLSPEQRTALANLHKADLFISIHANSSPSKAATGIETYYLNFTSSPEAMEVAARENASSQRSVSELSDLIKKIALRDKIDESREFAAKVQSALFQGSTRAGNRTRDRGVRKAPFIVLIGAQMPSVLTEVGFLSNAREEGLLKKPDYRQKIAESLLRGILQYTDGLSHFDVAQTVGN